MTYSVAVRIGEIEGRNCPVQLQTPDGTAASASVPLQKFTEARSGLFSGSPPDATWLSGRLFDILFGGREALLDATIARAGQVGDEFVRVELEIPGGLAEELPWELATAQRSHAFEIVRLARTSARLARRPLNLPLRLLVAQLASPSSASDPFPIRAFLLHLLGAPERLGGTFRPTEIRGASRDDLNGVLSKSPFDIVHLQVRPAWLPKRIESGSTDVGAIDAPGQGPALLPDLLGRLLERAQTRLLILQTEKTDKEYLAAYQLTHLARDIVTGRGPAVLIVPFDATSGSTEFLEAVYANIAHDNPIDAAVREARTQWRNRDQWLAQRAILVLARGAENLLRISPLVAPIVRRAGDQQQRIFRLRRRLDRLAEHPQLGTDFIKSSLERANRAAGNALTQLAAIESWIHERGGLIRLDDATQAGAEADQALESAELRIEDAERRAQRVVNSCFVKDGEVVSPRRPLVCDHAYNLRLQVGPPWRNSHVRGAAPIPEQFLERFYDAAGTLQLDVSIHSDDFIPLEGERFSRRMLELPRLGPSELLEIGLRAPAKPGQARLRACLYYRQNLLQSLMINAKVGSHDDSEMEDGNFAEIEFSMADTMLNVGQLPARSVNFLTNEKSDGDHTFVVHGPDFEKQYSLPDSPAIKTIRQSLQKICSKLDRDGKPVAYLFSDSDNSGNESKLVSDMMALAPTGYTLYFELISRPGNEAIEKTLHALLAQPRAIQVSITASDKNVFPWAFLYDKPFVSDPQNKVCPHILQRIAARTAPEALQANSCIDRKCPHADDTNVICPLGFWGFRHHIDTFPPQGGDAATTIHVTGTAGFLMAVHRELAGRAHRAEIEAAAKIKADYRDAKKEIGAALSTTKPHAS